MRNTCLCVSLTSLLLLASTTLSAGPQKSEPPSIYFTQVPSGLEQKLARQLEEHRNSLPVSRAKASEVRGAMKALDLTKPDTMRALDLKVDAVGPCAIPVVEEFTRSQSDSVREGAMFALKHLFKADDGSPKESTLSDCLIATLMHRSIFDRSRRVRSSAITGLRRTGLHRRGAAASAALAALSDACFDPDPKLEDMAQEYYEMVERAIAERG